MWGFGCAEGTGQRTWHKLTELRRRRTADVQKQRLRQPCLLAGSFVFLDILALFPSKGCSHRANPGWRRPPKCGVCDFPKGQVSARGTI